MRLYVATAICIMVGRLYGFFVSLKVNCTEPTHWLNIFTGLARKEDFPYITYYCPHCHALNGSQQPGEHEVSLSSGKSTPTSPIDGCSGTPKADNMSSISGNAVKSSLATVEELPGGETSEKELDPHAS